MKEKCCYISANPRKYVWSRRGAVAAAGGVAAAPVTARPAAVRPIDAAVWLRC